MLTTRNLQFRLPSGRTLTYPDLSVDEGGALLLQGPSGRGKSLLLQHLAGILNARIRVSGTFSLGTAAPPVWVPPEPSRVLPPGLRLGQHLKALGLERDRVERLLARFAEVRSVPADWPLRYPDQLSGGELQRVALALLLSRQGNVWLVDEPTIGLDAELRILFPQVLTEVLAEAPGSILLAASHDSRLLGALPHETLDLDSVPLPSPDTREPPASAPTPWLRARGLFVQVPGQRRWLLGGLNLTLVPGQIHWVRGSSGSGKTLLARSLLRLIDKDEGVLLWETEELRTEDLRRLQPRAGQKDRPRLKRLRPELGWLPQDSRGSFLPGRSVGRQLERRLDALTLAELGLDSVLLERRPEELSTGELKRIDLLRVLAQRPRLLILDEPFSALDRSTRRLVLAAVRRWSLEGPCAVLLYSHEEPEENGYDSFQEL